MSAAILFPAVCVSDVMDKARMCSKSIKYVTIQLFPACHEQTVNQQGCTPRSSNSQQTCTFFSFFFVVVHNSRQNNEMKPGVRNICTFSMFWGPLVSLFQFPGKGYSMHHLVILGVLTRNFGILPMKISIYWGKNQQSVRCISCYYPQKLICFLKMCTTQNTPLVFPTACSLC